MITNDRFDRRLPDLLHELAGTDDDFLDEVLQRTVRTRQRPAWTFPERWLPMADATRRPYPSPLVPNRSLVLIALLALLVAAVAAISLGSRFRQAPLPLPAAVDIQTAGGSVFATGHQPHQVSIGDGYAWVNLAAEVAQFDVATGELIRTIQISEGTCGSITAAFSALWVATCAEAGIARVDLEGQVSHTPVDAAITDQAVTVEAGEDGIWLVVGAIGDQLLKVDPVTMEIVATHAVPPGSAAATPGFGSVWIVNRSENTVARLDPSTGTIGRPIAVGRLPRFLAVGEGAVWVLNETDGTVSRIDPATNAVQATIPVGQTAAGGDIAVAAGAVWVRRLDALVAKIDPATNTVVQVLGTESGFGNVAAGEGALWITDLPTGENEGTIWRLPLE